MRVLPISYLFIVSVAALFGSNLTPAGAAPAGFTREIVTTGLSQPTSMAFAPDGRLFVTERSGQIRVLKNGVLLDTAFVSISADSDASETGLLGIAFDPRFALNRYVYVYYTVGPGALRYSGARNNRVSRLTANGDVALPGSERILLDRIPADGGNHNGGAIHFGPDLKLYIAIGDGGVFRGAAQRLFNLRGKILRINSSGSIPADNPYFGQSDKRGEIWASGFRNPWRFTFRPTNGALIIADVGQNTWEEIDVGIKAGNYGWPVFEGPCPFPNNTNCTPNRLSHPQRFQFPAYFYDHTVGSTVIGGAFANGGNYPAPYRSAYFYGDWAAGWIRILTFNALNQVSAVRDFDTLNGPVDFVLGPDKRIYVLSINEGSVYRYSYTP